MKHIKYLAVGLVYITLMLTLWTFIMLTATHYPSVFLGLLFIGIVLPVTYFMGKFICN